MKLRFASSRASGNSMRARLLPNDPSAVNIDGISHKHRDTGESEKLDNQFAFNNPRSLRRMYSAEPTSQGPELPARKSACGLDALSSPRRQAWPRSMPVQNSPVCLWMVHAELTCTHVHTYVSVLRAHSAAHECFTRLRKLRGTPWRSSTRARSLRDFRILRHEDDRREYTRILNIQEFKISKASKIRLTYEFLIIRKYINWPM